VKGTVTNTCTQAQGLFWFVQQVKVAQENMDKWTEGHALSFAGCLLINWGHGADSSYACEQLPS